MGIIGIILALLLQGIVGGAALYLGGKITKEDVMVLPAFLIALAGAVCGLIPVPIPFISTLIGWIVMLVLITKWCGCEAYPSGVLLIVVSGILQILFGIIIGGILVSCSASHSDDAAMLRVTPPMEQIVVESQA